VDGLPRGGSNGARWRHYRMAKHHRAEEAMVCGGSGIARRIGDEYEDATVRVAA